jgi:hypothetical protein
MILFLCLLFFSSAFFYYFRTCCFSFVRCAWEYGIPFDAKLKVYRRLLPSGNYLSQGIHFV